MAKEKKMTTIELMAAEYHYGFYNGVYGGVPTDFILLEMPRQEPDGSWVAKAVPIANSEIPVALGDPDIIKLENIPEMESEKA